MKLSKAQRAALHQKFGGRCAYCGSTLTDRWHADHVEHVERKMGWIEKDGRRRLACVGGVHRPERDTVTNMNPACPPCNIDKHAMTLEDWRGKLGRSLGVLARNHPTYRHAIRFGLLAETPHPIVFYFEAAASQPPGGGAS